MLIMETLLVFSVGILAGLFAGILPGIGGLVCMTVAWPWLMTLEPANILIFYVSLISVDQFFNGITAIVFGIPGSNTSVPTMIEGHRLFRQGRGGEAIMYSAIGSWFASLFSVLLIVAMLPILYALYGLWSTTSQSLMFTFAMFVILLVSRNRWYVNLSLFGAGLVLAKVGFDESTYEEFGTFGLDLLYSGLPTLPVLAMLFVLPMLLKSRVGHFDFPGVTVGAYWDSAKRLCSRYGRTLVRSGLLGSVGGFVPGLAYGFSSILAYTTERWMRRRRDQYRPGDMNCLIAAESANNAGAFTQLVPLLFLGIPITATEVLIYHVLEARNLPVSIEWFSSTFEKVVLFFLVSSAVGLLLSAKYVNVVKVLNGVSLSHVYAGIMLFLLGAIWYTGSLHYAGMDYVLIALMLMPLGVLLKNTDPTPLVIAFLLAEPLVDGWVRMVDLYF